MEMEMEMGREKQEETVSEKESVVVLRDAVGNEGKKARRRRMEIRRLKVIANATATTERYRKRPRATSSSLSASAAALNTLHDYDCEGEGSYVKSKGRESSRAAGAVGAGESGIGWGCASMCGRRREMEDAVAAVPGFLSTGKSLLHFFGVFDGHGGAQAANFCKNRLHEALMEELEAEMEEKGEGGSGGKEYVNWHGRWERALIRCFNKVDAEIGGKVFRRKEHTSTNTSCCGSQLEIELEQAAAPAPDTVGSTAVVAIVGSSEIIASNCGDSRVVLCRGGKAVALSMDHKPEREDEMARIEAAGGRVIHWNGYRVFGVLAMSRAIGDYYLKPYLISEPEVTFTRRTDQDECLILASDGLWDVLSNEEACQITRRCLARFSDGMPTYSGDRDGMNPLMRAIAEHLSKVALQRGSSDNITVVVVDLRRKQS